MTYKTKLLLNFTLLFAVFTALLVVFQYNREKQYKRDLLDSRLRSYADMVGETVDQDKNSGDTVRYTRSEEHTSELQSHVRIPHAVFCLKKKTLFFSLS